MTHRYRLHDSLGYQLSIASRLQEQRLDERLKTLGLTRTTWCVLLAVGNEALVQPSEIAGFVGIDRTATSRALRTLEAQGLIVRRNGTDDRRTTRVELTAAGRAKLDSGTPMAIENNRRMRDRLTADEHAELMRMLVKVHAGETGGLKML